MKIEICMIRIHYNHKRKPMNKVLPIQKVNVGDIITEEKEKVYIIPTHYRNTNEVRISQVGIRIINKIDEVLEVKLTSVDGKSEIAFEYNSEKNIWFQPTLFSNKKTDDYYESEKKSMLIGMTNAGSVLLKYKVVNGKFETAATLHFEPSVLPMQDYREMVADLYNIREELVRDDLNIAKVKISKKSVVDDLKKHLKNLRFAVDQINSTPHSRLQQNIKKVSSFSQATFNLRREMDEYFNPGKPFYRTSILESVDTTYENILIKQLLIDLVNYAKSKGSEGNLIEPQSRGLFNERKMYFDKSDSSIKKQLGNIVGVEKNEHYQEIYNIFKKQEDEIINRENQLRDNIRNNVDFFLKPNEDRGYRLDLNLKIKGTLTSDNEYAYFQSTDKIITKIKYDNQKPQLKVTNYIVYREGGFKTFFPNSHYGYVELITKNIISHWLLHWALAEGRKMDKHSEESYITICGIVKLQSINQFDPIRVQQEKEQYGKYKFIFTHINKISINGIDIEAPKKISILEDFLKKEFPIEAPLINDLEDIRMKRKQLDKLKALSIAEENVKKIGSEYDKVKETAKELLELPLFKSLVIDERIQFRSTQVFLHNPPYRLAWQSIKQIKETLSSSLFINQEQHLISTKKVRDIFEIWTLYKMIQLLTKELGWVINSGQDIITYLDTYLITGKQNRMKKFNIKLRCNQWEIELLYEPKIYLENDKYLLPDFVLKFFHEGNVRGLAILDAKYRNYTSQKELIWKKDIIDTAIRKYGQMEPVEENWDYPIIASGIIHSDTMFSENKDEKFNPYHVMYNEDLFETNLLDEKPHRYNSIYMIPSNTYVFKNWFRMIMEFHLESYKVCWSCGEQENISEFKKLTNKKLLKYHYTCNKCEEFWVKVHCNNTKNHKLIKHLNNYHLQVKRNNKWFVVCPYCGNGDGKIRKDKSANANSDINNHGDSAYKLDSQNIKPQKIMTDEEEGIEIITHSLYFN